MKTKKNNFICLFLLAFFLFGCGLGEGEEPPAKPMEVQAQESDLEEIFPKEESSTEEKSNIDIPLFIDVLFASQKVKSETFISNVNAGDVVKIQFSGVMGEDKFSKLYKKSFTSKWRETRCRYILEGEMNRRLDCDKLENQGSCKASYKDYLGKDESSIKFKKKPKEIPIRWRIGSHIYNIGDIEKHSKNEIHASFEIAKEMLQDTDELYLLPIHDFKRKVKIGFLGFDSCDGLRKENFHFEGSMHSELKSLEVKREFQVSLQIIKRQSKEE